MVLDLNKNFGGSTDLAKKRHGSADLHTPIQPPLSKHEIQRHVDKNNLQNLQFVTSIIIIIIIIIIITIFIQGAHFTKNDIQ